MTTWDSKQYEKFIRERTQPAIDLVNRIPPMDPKTAIDIGCGPGNSTRVLADKFPQARVIGVDASKEMLAAAKREQPKLAFQLFDANRDCPNYAERFDLVFSNACIQWIPDHPQLLKNLMGMLRTGGVLAVQTPMNDQEPIHCIISQLVQSEKWRAKLPQPRVFHHLKQEEYFDLLAGLASDFTVWETVYCHRMPSHESILEWYKGTGLRPYLSVLGQEDAAELAQDVLREVKLAYPVRKNGEILFRFPRFFFLATK